MSNAATPGHEQDWPEAARAALLEPLKARTKPIVPAVPLLIGAGAPVLGFHDVEFESGLPFRWLGPEPRGAVILGPLRAGITTLTLILARPMPPGVAIVELALDGRALAPRDAALPATMAQSYPRAWAIAATLPANAAGAAWSRLDIHLSHTAPDPGRIVPAKLVGLPLHALRFDEGDPA